MRKQESQPKCPVLWSPHAHTPSPFLLAKAPRGEPSSCHVFEEILDLNLRIQTVRHLSEHCKSPKLGAEVGATDCASVLPGVPMWSWATVDCRQRSQDLPSRETGVQQIHSALVLPITTFYLSLLFSGRLLWCPGEHVRVPGSH